MMRLLTCGLAIALLVESPVSAQLAASPEPTVTATIDPPRVVVGQRATLIVTVLAPNFMPAPPELPDFQVRNAVTRSLGAVNQVDHRGDVTYAGVRYEFAVYPQEPGSYAVAGDKITVTYAADPPQTRTVTIELPRISLDAFIPDAAQNLDPFVAAEGLTLEQSVKQSSQGLKVGDSFIRTLTVKADGTPAMLLPPASFARLDGLALYPGQPSLQDNLDRRTSALVATRTDEATYMLEKPGDYTLPAIDLAWWNVRDGKIERARADSIVLHVAANPAAPSHAAVEREPAAWNWRTPLAWLLDHWLLLAIAGFALALIAWCAPALVGSIRRQIANRRAAYRQSEAWFFERLEAALHEGNSNKAYLALLDWLKRFTPSPSVNSVDAFKQAAQDPELDQEIAGLESSLYGPHGRETSVWSPTRLIKLIRRARRRLLQFPAGSMAKQALPAELNPLATYREVMQRRPVAR